MKSVAYFIFGLVPLVNPSFGQGFDLSSLRIRFQREDDQSAVRIYLRSARPTEFRKHQLDALSGLTPEDRSEGWVCTLIDTDSELEWVSDYSATRTSVLGKMGIRPESVEILTVENARALALLLADRIKSNHPLRRNCGFVHRHGGMRGDGYYSTTHIYELGDFLKGFIQDFPSFTAIMPLDEVQSHWKTSVIDNAEEIASECDGSLAYYKDGKLDQMPDERQRYRWDCRTVIDGLHVGISPELFHLDPVIAQKLTAVK